MIFDAGDQIIGFPLQMWTDLFIAVTLLFIVEIIAAIFIWRRHQIFYKKLNPQWLTASLIALYFISHFIHIYADAQYDRSITRLGHYYPLLIPATASSFMIKHGWADVRQGESRALIKDKSSLNYPLKTLAFLKQSEDTGKPLNLLMIVVDSWRFDMMNASVTPNMYSFANKSVQYVNHFSGSNDTRNGIFSLFYGLPATYWKSFENNQMGPVIIDRMLSMNYQTGIFSSAPLNHPEFDRTVFKEINDLQTSTEGKTADLRDIKITEQWKKWLTRYLKKSPEQPFFGMLFYDSIHAYQYPDSYPRHFKPTLPHINYFDLNNEFDLTLVTNFYKNITHFVDSLIGLVIDDLTKKNLLQNTVVLITSDHGQELNDNKLNFWGHNGNYSRYQTQVPMIIYWPGKKPEVVSHMTTHYDIAPTIMNNLLYCDTDVRAYSLGRDLFRNYIAPLSSHIMGNYSSFSILDIQNKLLLVKDYNGTASTFKADDLEESTYKISPGIVKKALEDMAIFYK